MWKPSKLVSAISFDSRKATAARTWVTKAFLAAKQSASDSASARPPITCV
ncbi:MAG: hypothetical protein IPJ34_10145 [Myxococcales bacterium]|nr:hypothetical protein [Myxococcales bacterium]